MRLAISMKYLKISESTKPNVFVPALNWCKPSSDQLCCCHHLVPVICPGIDVVLDRLQEKTGWLPRLKALFAAEGAWWFLPLYITRPAETQNGGQLGQISCCKFAGPASFPWRLMSQVDCGPWRIWKRNSMLGWNLGWEDVHMGSHEHWTYFSYHVWNMS